MVFLLWGAMGYFCVVGLLWVALVVVVVGCESFNTCRCIKGAYHIALDVIPGGPCLGTVNIIRLGGPLTGVITIEAMGALRSRPGQRGEV